MARVQTNPSLNSAASQRSDSRAVRVPHLRRRPESAADTIDYPADGKGSSDLTVCPQLRARVERLAGKLGSAPSRVASAAAERRDR